MDDFGIDEEDVYFVYYGEIVPRHRRKRQTVITLYPITYELHPAADTRRCLALKVLQGTDQLTFSS
jgi:hypothetical protein